MVLRLAHCKVAGCLSICDGQKRSINGIQGSLHNMEDKIQMHQKSDIHLYASVGSKAGRYRLQFTFL